MSLLNPLLLATLAAIITVSPTQSQGQREANYTPHPHTHTPVTTSSSLLIARSPWRMLSTGGDAERN